MKRLPLLLAVSLAVLVVLSAEVANAEPTKAKKDQRGQGNSILGEIADAINLLLDDDTKPVSRGQVVVGLKDAFENRDPEVNIPGFGVFLQIGDAVTVEEMPSDGDDDPPTMSLVLDGRGTPVGIKVTYYTYTTTTHVDEDGTVLTNTVKRCYSIGTSWDDWNWPW